CAASRPGGWGGDGRRGQGRPGGPAAVPAVGAEPAHARRREGGLRPHRPFPAGLRLRAAQPSAAPCEALAARSLGGSRASVAVLAEKLARLRERREPKLRSCRDGSGTPTRKAWERREVCDLNPLS